MSFLRKNQELIQATRAFCEAVSEFADPVQQALNKIGDPEAQIAWTIAAEAMHQSISLGQLADLVSSLSEAFPGDRLWALPAIREADVNQVMRSKPWLQGWPLGIHLPGILNSVGNWIRVGGATPKLRLQKKGTAELWRELGSIYFMGKTNPVKPKVLALLQRLRMPQPLGLGMDIASTPLASGNPWPLPVSVGARKWLKAMGPNPQGWMESHSDAERLQYFQRMYSAITPRKPEQAFYGLSFFLEGGGSELLCRNIFEGCRQCPLATLSILSSSCPQRRV